MPDDMHKVPCGVCPAPMECRQNAAASLYQTWARLSKRPGFSLAVFYQTGGFQSVILPVFSVCGTSMSR